MALVNLKPDGDVTTDWDTVDPGPNHWEAIDELVSAPNDADFIETTTIADVDEFTMEDTPGNTDEVTNIDLNVRAKIDDVAGTAKIRLELFHTAGTPVTGNPQDVVGADLGGYGVLGDTQKTWGPALTLTKAEADSLQLRTTFLAA